MKARSIFGVLSTCLLAGAASAASVTFDAPGELVNRFALNTNNGNPVRFTQVAAGGLGNSGAVDYQNTTESDHTTAVFNEQSYAFANIGDSVTVSHFILRRDASQPQTPWTHVGILSDLGERMDAGSAGNSFASIRFDPSPAALATDVIVRSETKVSGGQRVRTTFGAPLSLVAGHWYSLATTYDYVSASNINVSVALEDWGTDGDAFQNTVFTLPATSIGLTGLDAVNGDGSVWAGFRDFHEGGADLTDNFAATPEPATFGCLLIAGLLGLRARRA